MLTEQNFVFILARPNFLGNIGSAARVMKNFGFNQLRLIAPPKNYLDSEARRMAVDAFDVLKKARVFKSLPQALADINLVIGSSCGQYRRNTAQNLSQLAEDIFRAEGGARKDQQALDSANLIAIVFGDERNGMTNEEIERCHKLMRIEANPQFPSLNLSQALGIVAYQLSLKIDSPDNKAAAAGEGKILYMSGAEEDELMERIAMLMDRADFSKSFSREKVASELRTTIQRLGLSQREGLLWQGLLSKILARLPSGQ